MNSSTLNVTCAKELSKLSSRRAFVPKRRIVTNKLQSLSSHDFKNIAIVIRAGQKWDNNDYWHDGSNQNEYEYHSFSSQQQHQSNGGEYSDTEDFDDRGPSQSNPLSSSFKLPDIIRKGNRKIGLSILGIGAVLTALGVSLFFNKMLMRLGNLFFVAGVPITIGPGRTAGYFFQPKKARATICLSSGIILVFFGWPIIGIVLETFGFLNLFGNLFPIALAIIKQMPVIGPLLKGSFRKRDSEGSRNFGQYDDYYDEYRDERYDEGRYDQSDKNYYN